MHSLRPTFTETLRAGFHPAKISRAPRLKTDAIGYNTMRLGSALAVIQYNEGFGGIQNLFRAFEIEITPYLTDAVKFLDRKRLMGSQFILKEQVKRFLKKTNRTNLQP